jgi:hypothetical protein
MNAASSWMMYDVPADALIYTIVAGLIEMVLLGLLYGSVLKPIQYQMYLRQG